MSVNANTNLIASAAGSGTTEVADGVTILGSGTAGDPFRVAPSASSGQNVYIDSENPGSATIFDNANPPTTNDDALKENSANTYYGTDGSVWTWNGITYTTKTYTFTTHQRDVFSATGGQTAFTLTKTPVGGTEKVHFTRNGVDISHAITVVGNVATYVPASNANCTMDSSDRVIVHYEAF